MKRFVLFAACLLAASAAFAETRIFVVDNIDGYEIDRCLASGEPCGAVAAAAICRTREYAKALEYGHIEAAGITNGISNRPADNPSKIVAVTCTR